MVQVTGSDEPTVDHHRTGLIVLGLWLKCCDESTVHHLLSSKQWSIGFKKKKKLGLGIRKLKNKV